MKIEKSILGVAGEFAVATELCRRNIYAQLTLGNQKRIDLLTLSRDGKLLKIEVKAKQGSTWPNVKGLSAADAFLVFVDFEAKDDDRRPDYYVLSCDDWRSLATDHLSKYQHKHPDRNAYLDEQNCVVVADGMNPRGKPYRGCSVLVADVVQHKEAWSKIISACAKVSEIDKSDSVDGNDE